jgi:DNA gyrase/topoisomerase IV subunit B
MAPTYSASQITVLKGLEPVRKRPAMYIGSTDDHGLHHLLWEVVDNAVDEAINGYASFLEVTLHADGRSATVIDNGRGIPVGKHPTEKRSALEVILTTLHAGAKFDQGNYLRSGGLHGVGSSVVNALSSEMVASIKRHGKRYEQRYKRGIPDGPVEAIEDAAGTGTSIFFRPDHQIFGETATYSSELVAEHLETKAYLTAGLRVVFRDEVAGKRHEYRHDGGIREMLEKEVERLGAAVIHSDPLYFASEGENGSTTRVEVALQWTESTRETFRSFANGIPTHDGGSHEAGLKDGIAEAMLAYLTAHDAIPRGVDVKRGDAREGVVAVCNVLLSEPQFQGQTKEKLNNPEVRPLIVSLAKKEVEQTMHRVPSTGNAVAMRIIQAARARAASRSAAQQVRRKKPIAHRLNLPGKLADCSSTDPNESEIFIVEGDSAGGSAKQGRDRRTQAILPLRGKVLNVEQAGARKVAANKELSDIVSALGCGVGDSFREESLRYGKVILLMDADSDGHHIATLLLTFFYRYLKGLIDSGRVFLAQPPLYRVDVGKETFWALDDAERDRIIAKGKRRRPNAKPSIQRFKGLGEMMPKTLYQTSLDPNRRRLLRVVIPEDQQLEAEKTIGGLMGKDASVRFRFIMENATDVDDLDV